jgi:hypothetical protein
MVIYFMVMGRRGVLPTCTSVQGIRYPRRPDRSNIMVRLEKQGDSFVMITGTAPKMDMDILINAISELHKNLPDRNKIKEGILYLDNSASTDLRKEIRMLLQNALESKA